MYFIDSRQYELIQDATVKAPFKPSMLWEKVLLRPDFLELFFKVCGRYLLLCQRSRSMYGRRSPSMRSSAVYS